MARSSGGKAPHKKVKGGVIDTRPKPGYVETPALSPRTGQTVAVLISLSKLEGYRKYGPFHKFYEALWTVRETLVDPEYILAYNEDEWVGYCYAKRVSQVPNNQGDKRPTEAGFTFLVFVTETFKAIEWGLEPCSRFEKPGMPADLRHGNMGEVLWPRR